MKGGGEAQAFPLFCFPTEARHKKPGRRISAAREERQRALERFICRAGSPACPMAW